MHIYCLPILDNVWNIVDTQLLAFVSPQRQKLVKGYHYPIDQKLSLYAALLTRMGISKFSGIPVSALRFQTGFMQKPILISAPQFHFNFSHTRNMILCGISDTVPIGVDVEYIDTSITIENMENVLHPVEFQYISGAPSASMRSYRFYKIWTQKEAYIKYLGTGFSEKVQNFNMLDPTFSSHIFTWQQDCYMCSVFMPIFKFLEIQVVGESDIQNYFLSLPS